MHHRAHTFALPVVLLALLGGCGRGGGDAPAAAGGRSGGGAQAVSAIAKSYFARQLELNPLRASELGDDTHAAEFGDYLSATWLADSLANEQDTQAALNALDPARMAPGVRLARDALLRRTATEIEGFRYPSELLVLDPFDDLPGRFAAAPRGAGRAPLADVAAFEAYLQRLDGFAAWADQAVNNLRLGLAKEVVHPRVIVERSLPGLAAVAATAPTESAFWAPAREFPASVAMADRARLARELELRIRERVLPAYSRLHGFLRDEYLPRSRAGVAFSELPGGVAWYAYLVRAQTQSAGEPAQVHAAALAAVDAWRGRVPSMPGVFAPLPARPSGYLVDPATARAWRAHLAAEAPAEDVPIPSTGAPPTRGLQVAALAAVDTGVHAVGWSRERAIAFLGLQLGLDAEAATREVDRCIAQPARALSAFAGLRHFPTLLREARRRALPSAVDPEFTRRVHDALWMPLPMLGEAVLATAPATGETAVAAPQ